MNDIPSDSGNPRENFQTQTGLLFQALEAVNTGVAVIDPEGNFSYVNKTFGEIHGYEGESLFGKHYMNLIPEEEKEMAGRNFDELIREGKKISGERKLKKKDGSIIEINFTSDLLEYNSERYILISVNDISPYKTMEQELTSNESMYRSLLEDNVAKSEEIRKLIMNAALDAIICINKAGDVTLWNPQAEKTFGWSSAEVMGKCLSNIIIPLQFRTMHDRGIENYLKTGHGPALNVLLELTAINRSGQEFPIELTVLPIKQEEEEEFFCAFIRDITERKKAETTLKELNHQMAKTIDDLAKSNTELEHFAYIASHDLQEPLRMVTNFLGQLDKKYNDQLDEKGRQYLHFAVDGAVRMRKIILDLLEYSRIGKLEQDHERLKIREVVSEVVTLNKNLIDDLSAEILYQDLPVIVANRTSILQLFQNLIGNALKYHNSSKPVIQITASEDEYYWNFAVCDNGIGIDSRFFDKIFVIFQRLHNREEYSGTGIGLAICKKIVETHGGRIWVTSEPGRGSTFYFTIKK
ncbi:MAG TPA: PAS domain S-box protein [Flavobacterium sp.]|jgi:PAS domain S-box-containing protein